MVSSERKHPRFYFVGVACLLFLVVVWILPSIIRGNILIVNGASMEPSYFDNSVVFYRKLNSPEDLSQNHPACWVIDEDGNNLIKRLIGYPGDIVDLIDGDTYVNGELLMKRSGDSYDNRHFELGEDDYLFLGDNRDNSRDARWWDDPFISFENIMGEIRGSELNSQ